MTHFGIICPPYPGHLNPQSALGRELQKRGHQVTVLQLIDLEKKVQSEGLEFFSVGLSLYQPGLLAETFQQLGQLSGIKALQYSVDFCQHFTEILCQDAPKAIAKLGIEALLVDQLEPVGETIAEYLNLPLIVVSCGQAIHRRGDVPPFFTPWLYQNQPWAKLRNQIAYFILDYSCQRILNTINHYRQQWKLPPYPHLYGATSTRLAHISQQPEAFDFPIPNLPKNFYYTGPFRNQSPQNVSFPYERLTGQPLIYASLGSVQNTKVNLFRSIAEACQELDAQLVITHGGGMSETEVKTLPGSPLVVEYAPQVEVLAKASLTITHGGMNTVMDSLSYGVPLVAIPITFEQPGTGARIRWTKTGEVIPVSRLNVSKLRQAIQQVLTENSYSENALKIRDSIRQAGGVKRAADLIEQCLKQPLNPHNYHEPIYSNRILISKTHEAKP
ncbi:glycosyltransferase [Planktothrix mougeotii]|uniref:Glycosyltransferase n=1 Tax=Planktothrix mougeotii LEGE 06226 TaxID=1828728 RepID=A0ABR9UEZ1_9CYAN|nr:glycosyltransferase [Planktothrix mougeotii]MBE9145003.1 glycosyltransferase [Planktothrix mougeotii LEGE 06226]